MHMKLYMKNPQLKIINLQRKGFKFLGHTNYLRGRYHCESYLPLNELTDT